MRRRPELPTVERKIYFYRVDAGDDAKGAPIPFNPVPALQYLNTLPFDEAGRYMRNEEGNYTCCWIDSLNSFPEIRFGQSRRVGLPMVEQQGNLKNLPIPQNSGLLEAIQIIFFSNNVVGADFNFYGPRLSRLSIYLEEKAREHCPPVTFEPLLRNDVMEQINRLRDARLFQLKIRAPYADTIRKLDISLGNAFKAAAEAGEAEELEITLHPKRYSRGTISHRIIDLVRRLAERSDIHTEASKFHIKGEDTETGQIELIDVLKDQLIFKRHIVKQNERGRALDPQSAYSAIKTVYDENKEDIEGAAGIRPCSG